jgi:hypothetical protein
MLIEKGTSEESIVVRPDLEIVDFILIPLCSQQTRKIVMYMGSLRITIEPNFLMAVASQV